MRPTQLHTMTRSFSPSCRPFLPRPKTALPLAVLFLALLLQPLRAAPGDVDPTFSADVTDFGGGPATIEAVAVQSDGKILIGGNFYNVDGVPSIGVARLNQDGSLDASFTSPLSSPTVFALAITASEKILVGGNFFTSPTIRRFLVELNDDGSVSDTFANLDSPNFDTNGNIVLSIVIDSDGKILIGGSFYFVANVPVAGLARISAGSLDTALGTAAGLQNDITGILAVRAIALQTDGKIVIGGEFLTNQTAPQTKNFARLNANGTIDTTFDNHGTPDLEVVYGVAIEEDEQILAAGSFDTIGGVISPRLARVNPDGSIDQNHVAINIQAVPFALRLQPGGKILLGQTSGEINGQERNGIARLNPDFSLDPFYPSPDGVNGEVHALALPAEDEVLIGGRFPTVAGLSRPTIARLLDGPVVVTPSQFLNLSTRLRVQTGDKVLIGGFIVTGNTSKKVILRAIGPSLGPFGIADALANPVLELHAADGSLITSNDDWKSTQQTEIEATGLAPQNDLESAIVATLAPAAYTAIVSGQNASGVVLVEVYDLDTAADAELANLSTRGFVETGDNIMIGGFILGNGTGVSDVVIRALGPSLTPFGVADALADPTLEIRDANGALLATNDNWKDTQQSEIAATGLAPPDDLESAILRTFAPGAYTALVAGQNGNTGVALVELYRLP